MDEGKFLKVYANLPLSLRNEIVLVLPDKGPITWNAAYIEVKNKTELGELILRKLDDLKII
ncbi:MAG: hypothetical protein PHO56_02545 [Patescibacteria group bacterium]|nr:hypothetical protein [Patescibacteria group bacterium]